MKISELIKSIVQSAEQKFGVDESHNNDGIEVAIFYSPENTFQIWLARPTQSQLDSGQVEDLYMDTIKRWDTKVAFYTEAKTLLCALRELEIKIDNADHFEFPNE